MTTVHDAQGRLIGIFTDGDLRRCLHQQCPIHTTPIMEVMNADFKTIDHQQSAVQALAMLHEHKITSLVVEAEQRIIGVIHMHDLLHHGITAPQQEHCL